MHRTRVLVLAAAILATGAGFFAYRATLSDRSVAEAVAELMRLRLPDVFGKEQSLAQWRDKVLIVNFWATWCEPCREEMPSMNRLRAALAGRPFEVLAVNLAESEPRIRRFMQQVPRFKAAILFRRGL